MRDNEGASWRLQRKLRVRKRWGWRWTKVVLKSVGWDGSGVRRFLGSGFRWAGVVLEEREEIRERERELDRGRVEIGNGDGGNRVWFRG